MVLPLVGAAAIGGLEASITKLTGVFTGYADQAQKTSLALGSTFEKTRDRLAPSLDGLRGSIENRLTAGIIALDNGLRGNVAGVAKLINQQKLTDSYNAQTAKSFAKLENVLGLSNEETNRLAASLISTGNTYGISTDKLVDSISKLDKQFTQFQILGTEAIPGAIATLQAELGAAFSGDRLQQVVALLTDTSAEGLKRLAVLGLADFRERLQAVGKDQVATTALLKEGIQKAADQLTRLTGGAEANSISFDAYNQQIGRAGFETIALNRALQQSGKIQNEAAVDYADTISTQLSEVWNPLKEAAFELYKVALPGVTLAAGKIKGMFEDIVNSLKDGYVETGGFEGLLKRIMIGFTNLQIALANVVQFFATMKNPVTGNYIFEPDDRDRVREQLLAQGKIDQILTATQVQYSQQQGMDVFRANVEKLTAQENLVTQTLKTITTDYQNSINERDQRIGKLQTSLETQKAELAALVDSAKGKSFEEFTQLEADMGRARLGLAEKANEHLEQVVQNTSPQETSVRLSETAVMLTDSIRGILGIEAPQSRAVELQEETNEILKVMARRTDAPAALTRQAQPAF